MVRQDMPPSSDPVIISAVADTYRHQLEAGAWGCVSLLVCVNLIQQLRPDLRQSAAISETMTIIGRIRDARA